LERIEALDRFGFDEVWVGEHHSGGFEIIACPEVVLAAAAERTRHIKLGTGVVSLPYHHPWLVADRMVLLDHLTRGRVIFGVGPGALPGDAYIMGIDPRNQRRMMEESLEAILALFQSEEPVSRQTDWFTLREARLHVRPFTHPHMEVAVAAMTSPSGPRLAGKYGASLLSLSMSSEREGFASIGRAWGVVEEQASKSAAKEPNRRDWRVMGIMHLADTRSQAIKDCTYGLKQYVEYFGTGPGFVPLAGQPSEPSWTPIDTFGHGFEGAGTQTPEDYVEAYARGGHVVIGTTADAIEYIERLIEQSGGFGTFLLLAHDWANPEATLHSYRLLAREVIPHFKHRLRAPTASNSWVISKRDELFAPSIQAIGEAISSYVETEQKE
jgi:limonene 1,2-monooxygenase